jgi:uncharacterized protein YndB with AHSA1/START domain
MECVAGDLEEEFAQHCAFRGRLSATRWYWLQVWQSVAPLVQMRIRSGEPTAVLLSAAMGVALPLLLLDRLWSFVYSQIPLKDGLNRAPALLVVNVLAVVFCGVLANPPTRLRYAAAVRAAAAMAAAGFALWCSQSRVPVAYSVAVLAASAAGTLLKLKRKTAAPLRGPRGGNMKWVIRIAGSVFALLLIGVVVLLAMGHRAGAGQLHSSVDIAAPPAQVWTWLSDGDKMRQWVSWTVEVRNATPQFDAVGAKRVMVMKDENNGGELIQIETICTEYAPPARMKVALSSAGMFDGEQSYRLTDLGNGRTRLELNGTFHFGMWMARLMEPLITPGAQKKMDADLMQLKKLAEGHAG